MQFKMGIISSMLFIASLLLLPLLGNKYHLHIAILSMIYIYPALGLNLIFGYTGMLSLAQGAFFGVGAYTTALLAIHYGWPFWLTFVSSGVFCAVISLLLAIPALRLRSYSFVMCTLGLVVIGEAVSKNWVSLTRGDMGISGVPRPVLSLWGPGFVVSQVVHYYYFVLMFAILGVFLFYWVVSSPAGRCMRAIRDEETLAESQGVYVWAYKLNIFALSAIYAGLGGSIYVLYMTIVSPLIFQMYHTLLFLIIVFAGGAGTVGGVVLGAFLFVAIPETLRITPDLRMIIYGLLFIFLAFRMPNGLGPFLVRIGESFFSSQPKR